MGPPGNDARLNRRCLRVAAQGARRGTLKVEWQGLPSWRNGRRFAMTEQVAPYLAYMRMLEFLSHGGRDDDVSEKRGQDVRVLDANQDVSCTGPRRSSSVFRSASRVSTE